MLNGLILYIGERETGEMLAARVEQAGGYVYLPKDLMQALGMYITYFPDAVVVDTRVAYGQEAFDHLRSVDAEPILLLTDEHVRSASVFTLPRESTVEAVVEAIDRLRQPQRVPNGVLRYA